MLSLSIDSIQPVRPRGRSIQVPRPYAHDSNNWIHPLPSVDARNSALGVGNVRAWSLRACGPPPPCSSEHVSATDDVPSKTEIAPPAFHGPGQEWARVGRSSWGGRLESNGINRSTDLSIDRSRFQSKGSACVGEGVRTPAPRLGGVADDVRPRSSMYTHVCVHIKHARARIQVRADSTTKANQSTTQASARVPTSGSFFSGLK